MLKQGFTGHTDRPVFQPAKTDHSADQGSGIAIAGCLNQYNGFSIHHPVNFYCRKSSPPERNYDTYVRELSVNVETMNQWRYYLEGANHKVLIQCNHMSLEYIQTSKVLSRRQARWAQILSSYDFVIEYFEGKEYPADGSSRSPDYEIDYERPTAQPQANLATTTVEPYDDFHQEINSAKAMDALAVDVKRMIVGTPIVDIHDLKRIEELEE